MSSAELWTVSWLLDVSIKAALLAVAAWLAVAACRIQNRTVRHRVWLFVAGGMLLLPALVHVAPGVPLPGWLYPALQPAAAANDADGGALSSSMQPPMAHGMNTRSPSESGPVSPFRALGSLTDAHDAAARGEGGESPTDAVAAPLPLPPAGELPRLPASAAPPVEARALGSRSFAMCVIWIYSAGVASLTVRLLIGAIGAWGLARHASPVVLPSSAIRLPKGARIVESDRVRVPVTMGYWRQVVVLPLDWKRWSDSFLAMILLHEGEHVRRRDTWTAFLASLNCAVYWFHPVAWIARRRLADLAEQICDDAVIRATGSRHDYAQNLLDMARRLTAGSGRIRPVGVAMVREASVVKRIEAIIDSDRPLSRKTGMAGTFVSACIAASVVILAAGLRSAPTTTAAETAAATVPGETAAQSEPTATGLKGRVVTADDGKPVAGAEVWLLTWKPEDLERTTVVTNDEGQFEFKELTEGRYTLAAYHQDLSSRSKRYKGYEAQAGDDSIVLKLRKAPSLEVKVVARADGRPIEGATVRLTWSDAKRDHRTDANGKVVIHGLTSEVWTIEARATGFAEDAQAVNLSGTQTSRVTARLAPGVELFGVVRDETGKGLPDVGICVFPSGMSGEQIEYMKTDANGGYRFEYLPIAGLTLLLSKDGYADFRPDVAITAPPGGQQKLNLTLPRRPFGGSVQGTVVDAQGNPVAGASVVNRGSSSNELRETTTDALGRYRLDDVYKGSGAHDLFVKSKGFAPQHLEFDPGDREHPAERNVTLAPGHRIRGRVINEEGVPLAGVRVSYAHGNRLPGSDFGGWAVTNDEGRFEFDSLPAECPFSFDEKRGYSARDDVTLPLDGQEEVVVALRTAGVIRGRVVDDRTGKPVSPFTVHVTYSPDRKPDDPASGLSGARALGGEGFAVPDGTFRMDDFVRGMPLQVRVEAEGYEPTVVRRVVAVADREAQPVEFRLAPIQESNLLTIAGRLVDEQGRPLAGAELRLIAASKRPFPRDQYPFNWTMIRSGQIARSELVLQYLASITDGQGRFRFEQVRSGGDIELVYWGENVSQNRRDHLERLPAEEQRNLMVTSKTPGAVRGVINRKAFPEVGGVTLSGDGFDDFHRAELSPGSDSYEIRNVPEGRYQLQVYGSPKRLDEQGGLTRDILKRIPIEVRSGETVIVDLGLESEGASQALKDSEKASPEKPGVADRGPAPRGSSAGRPASASEAASARVASVGDESSEIVIAGSVTDESGGAIGGARLLLPLKHDDDTRLAEATTTETGAFALRVPAAWTEPGAFVPSSTLWCYAPNHQIAAASAYQQLRRRSQFSIEIVLRPKADTGFIVQDAAGSPIRGARVEPMHFLVGSYNIIPRKLREIIAEETDEHGRVLFPEMGRDGFFSVQVTADGYGIQHLRLRDASTEPAIRTITLRPTGRLEGRLLSEDKVAIQSARIYVYQEDYLGKYTSGTAAPEVGEDGRFIVPAFAEGGIKLVISVDPSLTVRPRIPENLEIFAGETTRVEVPFEETVRVRGRVQTKEERAPVAGAMISVQYGSFRQGDLLRTDADGRFEANVLAGEVRRQLIMRPDEYADWIVEEADWQTAINVPAGAENIDLPPLELIETSERAGRLVDPENRPVAGAAIRAIIGNRVCAWGKSDEGGAFTLRLPKSFEIEKYDVSRSRETGPIDAKVIGESPLILQVLN